MKKWLFCLLVSFCACEKAKKNDIAEKKSNIDTIPKYIWENETLVNLEKYHNQKTAIKNLPEKLKLALKKEENDTNQVIIEFLHQNLDDDSVKEKILIIELPEKLASVKSALIFKKESYKWVHLTTVSSNNRIKETQINIKNKFIFCESAFWGTGTGGNKIHVYILKTNLIKDVFSFYTRCFFPEYSFKMGEMFHNIECDYDWDIENNIKISVQYANTYKEKVIFRKIEQITYKWNKKKEEFEVKNTSNSKLDSIVKKGFHFPFYKMYKKEIDACIKN